MAYRVFFTADAERDLADIDDWICDHDSIESADYVLSQIEDAVTKLEDMAERGSFPKELSVIGIKDYREIFFKPYRIIYRVTRKKVTIHVVADGRRDMQTLLARRLLDV